MSSKKTPNSLNNYALYFDFYYYVQVAQIHQWIFLKLEIILETCKISFVFYQNHLEMLIIAMFKFIVNDKQASLHHFQLIIHQILLFIVILMNFMHNIQFSINSNNYNNTTSTSTSTSKTMIKIKKSNYCCK